MDSPQSESQSIEEQNVGVSVCVKVPSNQSG